jgi:Uma2 family endonuclease
MGEVGILTPEDRVELIEGELIQKAPSGPEHAGAVEGLTDSLVRLVADRASVRVGLPIRLGDHSEPEPDLALVTRRQDRYRHAHPTAQDVLLLIEVAQSSLAFDRTAKLRLYAAQGIREYWIVNLPERCIEVCRAPQGDRYASVTRVTPGTALEPEALPGVILRVADLLG